MKAKKWCRWLAVSLAVVVTSLTGLVPEPAGATGRRIVVREGESIQAALDEAPPYSTIIVRPGVYPEALRIRTDGIKLRASGDAVIRTPEDADSECREFGSVTSICIAEHVTVNDIGLLVGSGLVRDVTVSGFTIEDSPGSAVGALAAEGITVIGNTISGSGCDGVFVVGVNRFRVSLNSIRGTAQSLSFCTGMIAAVGSENGLFSNNRITDSRGVGIAIANQNNSNIVVQGNRISGNCGGVLVAGDATSEGPVSNNNRVVANTITKNNRACTPFADIGFPEPVWGGFGVWVSGAQDTTVQRNVITDNVVSGPTSSAGGIRIEDAPETAVGAVTVSVNRVTGNVVDGDAVDINVVDGADGASFRRNICGVSRPDPSICSR